MKNGKQAETKIKRGVEVYAQKLIFLFFLFLLFLKSFYVAYVSRFANSECMGGQLTFLVVGSATCYVSKTSGSRWNLLLCLREACGSFTTQENEFLSVACRCVFERVELCS